MSRRPLALLAAATVAAGLALAAPAATAAPCQPESCPPPCPFEHVTKYGYLLCPQPV